MTRVILGFAGILGFATVQTVNTMIKTAAKRVQNGCKFVSPGFVDLFDMCHAAQLQGLGLGVGS